MDQNQWQKMKPNERVQWAKERGMPQSMAVNVATQPWNRVQSQVGNLNTSGPVQPAGPTAAEIQKEKEAAEVQKLRDMLDASPGYESSLTGSGWEQLYGDAMGDGPLQAYEALREQARAAQAAGQTRLAGELQDELQNIDIGRAGQTQNAYSQLAMGGGLSGGARERVAQGGLEQSLAQRQGGRLQNQRSLFDLDTATTEKMLGITGEEGKTRAGMRADVTNKQLADNAARIAHEQEKARRKEQFEADQIKDTQAQNIATTSAPKGGK